MNDFVTGLDARLTGLSAPRLRRSRRAAGGARRRAAAGTLLAAATALTLVALGATDEQRLPVFGTPTSDASSHRGATGFPDRPDLDYRVARRFATPGGPGFVIPTRGGDALCVALPDPEAEGAFGTSCAPVARVQRDGALALLVGSRRAIAAYVLPVGGRPPVTVTSGGVTRNLRTDHGVAVATLSSPGVLHYGAREGRATLELPGPFPAQNVLQCAEPAPQPSVTLTTAQATAMAGGHLSGSDVCG